MLKNENPVRGYAKHTHSITVATGLWCTPDKNVYIKKKYYISITYITYITFITVYHLRRVFFKAPLRNLINNNKLTTQ